VTPQEWSVKWPVADSIFREMPITRATREQLHYDEGKSAQWQAQDGSRWQAFYFRWYPARSLIQRARVQFAKAGHRPEACLPAIGMTLRADLGSREVSVNGVHLYFRNYLFDDQGMPLHVYNCVWEDRTQGTALGNPRVNTETRLQRVWAGNRSLGQRVLEIAVWGIPNAHDADAALVDQLKQIVVSTD
jgi:hypothetical protein